MPSLLKLKLFLRSLSYLIIIIPDLYRLKKDSELTKIRPFNFFSWHHGFIYFTAVNPENECCFLKIDTKVFCVENEYKVYCYLKNKITKIKTPEVKFFKKYKRLSVVSFGYISGEPLTFEKVKESPELLVEVYRLVSEYSDLGLCHRDIKLDNFILGDKLTYIDFTYSQTLDAFKSRDLPELIEAPLHIEKDLGIKINDVSWNDFHSMLLIFDRFILECPEAYFTKKVVLLREECFLKANSANFTYTSKSLYNNVQAVK